MIRGSRAVMALAGLIGVVGALSTAACGVSVTVAARSASSADTPTATVPTAIAPTATTSAPPAAATACDQNLTGCLTARPAGAVAWTNPSLGDGDTTIDKFVGWVYGNSAASSRTAEISRLSTAGVVEVTHRDWYVHGHDQANVYLIRFNSAEQAASDLSTIDSSAAGSSSEHTVALTGLPNTVSAYAYTTASSGYMEAKAYGYVGDVVMEVFFFSPKTLDTATMGTWVAGQYAALNAG